MQFFYSHRFHSSYHCQAYFRICEGLDITPFELVYENGGDFMANLHNIKKQFLAQLNPKEPFCFVGNSLGAFYLWQLVLFAHNLEIPTPQAMMLFNPVLTPLTQLEKYINKPQINSTTQKEFTLNLESWQSYAHALKLPPPKEVKICVCISQNDELINPRISQAYWQNYAQILLSQSGHSIADFSPYKKPLHTLLKRI
ncbi:YqiA/YcfP family alpha/beta fold hydrolase [Helicobacter labetoulli]|uniref:YqiA/YcfP family alpha/beta fold hydrolase n=1 Tax=Helicobacter labetoulli TaxID=2315333 RepID=UPI000EF69C25|nr:YqiA/YcfP family alpha/beta fold hydrolase [Helicobacter labetoulli]